MAMLGRGRLEELLTTLTRVEVERELEAPGAIGRMEICDECDSVYWQNESCQCWNDE